MPKITGALEEVFADGDNAVLGDVMTVDGPKPVRGSARRRRRSRPYYLKAPALASDLGLSDSYGGLSGSYEGVSRTLAPAASTQPAQPYSTGLQAPEDDQESLARLLVVPKAVVVGAAKGAAYGAVLGNQKWPYLKRIGGGAAGGAVAFPALGALAQLAERKLGEHGVDSPFVNAVLDDAAHVGGAVTSTVTAGGEATDGAIAGTAVVLASHILGWFTRR